MDVKAAIRQSLVVKLFPCTDLVKQVTKISTNTKPAPRTRARQVVVARVSVHTRVIKHARFDRILEDIFNLELLSCSLCECVKHG